MAKTTTSTRSVRVRLNIMDTEGNFFKDRARDFIVDVPTSLKSHKKVYEHFNGALVKAVTEWYNEDRDAVTELVDTFGCCSSPKNLEACIKHFPACCVEHIPEEIMARNGFRLVPEPDMEKAFYSDEGFLSTVSA